MALKLSWRNPNTATTKTTVYRGDTPLDTKALPDPLATLNEGVSEWVDDTAVYGRTYYYVLGSKTDADEVFTPPQKITVSDNRGVGGSVLLAGDDNLGYYGLVNSADFVNSNHILGVALNAGAGLPTAPVIPNWHKMVRDGKFIYVPDRNFGFTTWASLYSAGFVFGVDGPGDGVPTGDVTPTNQLRIIEFKGYQYKVRLLNGVVVNGVCEYNDLVYPIVSPVPMDTQRSPNFYEGNLDLILGTPLASGGSATNTLESNRGWLWMQGWAVGDVDGKNYPVQRGHRSVSLRSPPANTDTNLASATSDTVSASGIWFPVLELIGPIATVDKG